MSDVVRIAIPTLGAGGSERVCVTLANSLTIRGVRVQLLLVNATGPFLSQLDARVDVVSFQAGRSRYALLPMCRYLNRRPDLPVLVFGLDLGAGLGFFRKLGVLRSPVVYREGSYPELKNLRFAYKYGVGGVDGVVVQTEEAARSLSRLGVHVAMQMRIANPLNFPTRTPPPFPEIIGDAPRLLSVGRLDKVKGHARLLRAFANFMVQCPAAQLTIAGEGNQRGHLEEIVSSLNLGDNVKLPGYVADVAGLYSSHHIVVLSSYYEGLPNVLIEAIAAGCRILAADVPPMKEFLAEVGLSECLVRSEEFETSLSAGIHRVQAMPSALWQAAWSRLEALTNGEAVCTRYLDFYRRVQNAALSHSA